MYTIRIIIPASKRQIIYASLPSCSLFCCCVVSSFLKLATQSQKREILEQRWLTWKPHSSRSNSCCDDDDEQYKPPAAKKKKIVDESSSPSSGYALPDDIVGWVQSLKVKELQEDLHSRAIETNGLKLKKDLRKRLLQALESERMMSSSSLQQQPQQQHNQQQQPPVVDESSSSVPMEVEVVSESCDQSSVGQTTDYSESGMESNMAVAPQPPPETDPSLHDETEPARMSVAYHADGKEMADSIMESKKTPPQVIIENAAAENEQHECSDETMADAEELVKVVVVASSAIEPLAKENTTTSSSAPKQSPSKSRSRSPLKKVGSKVQSCIKAFRSHRGVDNSNKKHNGDKNEKVPLLAPHDNNIIESSIIESSTATTTTTSSQQQQQQPPSSSKFSASAIDKLQSEFRRAPSKLSKGSSASKVAHLKAQQEARRAKMEKIRSKVRRSK
jgi:hypothetical protein